MNEKNKNVIISKISKLFLPQNVCSVGSDMECAIECSKEHLECNAFRYKKVKIHTSLKYYKANEGDGMQLIMKNTIFQDTLFEDLSFFTLSFLLLLSNGILISNIGKLNHFTLVSMAGSLFMLFCITHLCNYIFRQQAGRVSELIRLFGMALAPLN